MILRGYRKNVRELAGIAPKWAKRILAAKTYADLKGPAKIDGLTLDINSDTCNIVGEAHGWDGSYVKECYYCNVVARTDRGNVELDPSWGTEIHFFVKHFKERHKK